MAGPSPGGGGGGKPGDGEELRFDGIHFALGKKTASFL